MKWIEPAQCNQKFVRADVPAFKFTCRIRLAKAYHLGEGLEVWYYDGPFMHMTVGSWPMPVDKQGMNVTVGTVASKYPLMA